MTRAGIYLAALLAAATSAAPVGAQTPTSTSGGGASSTNSTNSSTSTTGSFQGLSAGQQKIARALFEAQQPSDDGPPVLSLDQIAARKSDTGWGQVFKQMKSEGLVGDSKNLGQIVSGHATANGSTTTGPSSGSTSTVATTANGRQVGSGRTQTSTDSDAQGHGNSAHVSDASVTTADGGAASHGGGASGLHAH